MGKRGANAYGPEDHKRAFFLWKKHNHSMMAVSKEEGMPARQTLYKWSKKFPECTCQWHDWDELVSDISRQVKAEEYDAKYGETALTAQEQEFQEALEEFMEIVKGETVTLKFLKQMANLVMETIIRDIKKEKEDALRADRGEIDKKKLKASAFRPKTLKEAIALMDFVLKQQRIIQNISIPPEVLEGRAVVRPADEDNQSNLNLKVNLQDDELLGLLGGMYKMMDRKTEEKNIDNLLSFRPKSDPR